MEDKGLSYLAYEGDPDRNMLANAQPVKISSIGEYEYYPFIEITKSPLSLRLILPALDSTRVLDLVTKLYYERFGKVIGKLPLNASLIVSKRKFPLYILLDAGERMLNDAKFKEPAELDPWWEVPIDEYYGFYPIKKSKTGYAYNLHELAVLSKEKQFNLYPGYFDFDLLLATTDRYKINYENRTRTLSSRPYYFYQVAQMRGLWEILLKDNHLPMSQINFIEEMLTRKLTAWSVVNDANQEAVFKEFAIATLRNAFGEDHWSKMNSDTKDLLLNSVNNRLLLDTIILFKHTIKEKEVDENDCDTKRNEILCNSS